MHYPAGDGDLYVVCLFVCICVVWRSHCCRGVICFICALPKRKKARRSQMNPIASGFLFPSSFPFAHSCSSLHSSIPSLFPFIWKLAAPPHTQCETTRPGTPACPSRPSSSRFLRGPAPLLPLGITRSPTLFLVDMGGWVVDKGSG